MLRRSVLINTGALARCSCADKPRTVSTIFFCDESRRNGSRIAAGSAPG
jgi:hypothetical protein